MTIPRTALAGLALLALAGCGACGPSSSHATSGTATGCAYAVGQGPDVIERDVVPGQKAVAETVGAHAICGLAASTPSGSGFCSQIAFASSNPGYNTNAAPAAKLKDVIAQAGKGC